MSKPNRTRRKRRDHLVTTSPSSPSTVNRAWKCRRHPLNKMTILVPYFIHGILITVCTAANLPPYFTDDMNNHVIPENTPVGTAVYTLKAVNPEGHPLRYGIMGTDKLTVDDRTGIITVAKHIDREVTDRLKVTVTVEDVVGDGRGENNLVTLPVSITVSDQNDNPPIRLNQSSYESVEISEDTRVGSKILPIDVKDSDLTGMALGVNCTPSNQSPKACQVFHIEVKEATAGVFRAEIRLGKKLDYSKRSMYQFMLSASTYEEQELTMQVASELNSSNGSIEDHDGLEELEDGLLTMTVPEQRPNGMSMVMPPGHQLQHQHQNPHQGGPMMRGPSPQFSHAYATLHPHPTDSYDNLNILGEDTVAVHL